MNAKLTQSNFRDDVCTMRLNLNGECVLNCACANITDIDEVNITIHHLRKMAYHKVDAAIDIATADFLKSKLKNID